MGEIRPPPENDNRCLSAEVVRLHAVKAAPSLVPSPNHLEVPSMGKFKPFLFGVIAGAGVIFVALQYHVVQTHEGVRVVPRTPQHSLGLAYADIRNWDAAKWSDRPELARALVANGSTDLVAGSVASDLATKLTSDSPMDQLRGALNRFSESGQDDPDPLFDSFPGIQKGDDSFSLPGLDDSFAPFPEARGNNQDSSFADVLEPRATVASKATDPLEVFKPSIRPSDDFRRPHSDSIATDPSPVNDDLSPRRETELLEDLLFGDEPSPETGSNTRPTQQPSSGFGMFEDVTGVLESRANEALSRARQGFKKEVARSIEDSQNSIGRYARGQVRDSLPESVSSMFPGDAPAGSTRPSSKPKLPDAIEALKNGFDPFIK